MAWVENRDSSGFINLDAANVSCIRAEQVGSSWALSVVGEGEGFYIKAGPYSSQADALEAIRKLVLGTDASTIV